MERVGLSRGHSWFCLELWRLAVHVQRTDRGPWRRWYVARCTGHCGDYLEVGTGPIWWQIWY